MKMLLISLLSIFSYTARNTPTHEIHFDLMFHDQKIGHFVATEMTSENEEVRRLKSQAGLSLVSVHIETETTLTRKDGVLTEGISYRNANRGVENLHTETKRLASNKYQVVKNGESLIHNKLVIALCVTDLYFIEPVNVQWVYSSMQGKKLQIKHLGNGRYLVVSTEERDITYIYKNGQLVQTEISTPLGKIVSMRR